MEMNQHLASLVGSEVNIMMADGNSLTGFLADIKDDYFIMESDNSVIYHSLQNVKGFLKYTNKNKKSKKKQTNYYNDYSLEGMTLREVLEGLRSSWVTVNVDTSQNNGNNQNNNGYSGFLAEIEDDYVIIIGKEMQVHLNIDHINNIAKASMQSNNNNNNNNNSQEEDSGSYSTIRAIGVNSIFGGR